MENNKLNKNDYKLLINIYNKLDTIDGQLYDLNNRTNISNKARNFIICAMEEIRNIINLNSTE